jgi:hypothetical protein
MHAVIVADRAGGVGQARALAIFGGTVLAHPVYPDRTAERRKPFGKRSPEAASGTGDQGNLMLQGAGLVHSFLIQPFLAGSPPACLGAA